MRYKISFLIPVYNVAAYLEKCVDSILNQTYSNFEILLLDDGSTDDSPAICDSYARKDARVRVIHKENEGVSPTRNLGIRLATGDYLFYVDSDDLLFDRNVLSVIISNIEDQNCPVDLAVFNAVLTFAGENLTKNADLNFVTTPTTYYQRAEEFLSKEENFPHYVWNHLYRREFVIDSGLFFYGDLYEDTLFNLQLYTKNGSVLAINAALYIHFKRPLSLTTSRVSFKHVRLLLNMIATLCGTIPTHSAPKILKKRLYIEFDSLVKIMIKGRFSKAEINEFGCIVRQKNIRFIPDYADSWFKSFSINLFNSRPAMWSKVAAILFKLSILEKKLKG